MESVSFKNKDGQLLSGHLHFPNHAKPHAFAVFAHCFTCTKNIKAAINITQAMANEGIAVLRFDFTGLGESEGDFAATHFSSNVDDLIAASDFLHKNYEAPSLLVGHSLGGTAALVAAPYIDSCKAVATIGSPAQAEHVLHLLQDNLNDIEKNGEAMVKLAGRPFKIKKEFIENVRQQQSPKSIRQLKRVLLVMHSPIDELVDISNAAALFEHAMHPKSFVSLDHADHLLSNEQDSLYAGKLLANWAVKYIGLSLQKPSTNTQKSNTATAKLVANAKFYTEIDANGHAIIADEPKSVGGNDLGPGPYDLLSAALASCTTMTINLVANNKKIPLEETTVEIKHKKIHAEDCLNCEKTGSKIDQFERKLTLKGQLTDEQKAQLLKIADKCPVHRTLESISIIHTRLID